MVQWVSLAPRARLLFYLVAVFRLVFVWTPLAAVLGALLATVTQLTLAGALALGLWLLAALSAVWLPSLRFERWRYALTQGELFIHRGVVVRRLTAIPRRRVQHVDTHQGPLEQLLGLASVYIYTASGGGADGLIPGLLQAEASRIKDTLMAVHGDDGV